MTSSTLAHNLHTIVFGGEEGSVQDVVDYLRRYYLLSKDEIYVSTSGGWPHIVMKHGSIRVIVEAVPTWTKPSRYQQLVNVLDAVFPHRNFNI